MNHVKYTVSYLKEQMLKYDLSTKGKKTELQQRLDNYYNTIRKNWNTEIIYTNQTLDLNKKDELFLGTRYNKFDSNGIIRFVPNKSNYDMYIDKNILKNHLIQHQKIPTIVIETIINIYQSKEQKQQKICEFPIKNTPPKYSCKPFQQSCWVTSLLYDHQLQAIQWMSQLERHADANVLLYKHKLNNNQYKYFQKFDKSLIFDTENIKIKIGSIDNTSYHYLKTKGGVLGDAVGLGKTLSMIGLIIDNHSGNPIYNKVDPIKYNRYVDTNVTLVICPAYLVSQWSNEIFKHTDPPLKHYIITGKKQHQELTYKDMLTSDVIIVSDKFLRSSYYTDLHMQFTDLQLNNSDPLSVQAPLLNHIEWRRIILDEGHIVISNECLKLTSKFKWYVSGTPAISDDLVSFLEWNVESKLNPYIKTFTLARTKSCVNIDVPEYKIKKEYINMSFFETQIYDICKKTYSQLLLRQLCCTVLINENFKPTKEYSLDTFQQQLIVHNDLSKKTIQSRINGNRQEMQYFQDLLEHENIPQTHMIQLKTNIEHIQTKIDDLYKKITDIERTNEYQTNILSSLTHAKRECNICYEELNYDKMLITSCCHLYCDSCIKKIDKCSICRKTFTITAINNDTSIQYGSKIIRLIQYIQSYPNDKIIVYSQWNRTLQLVSKCLQESDIRHVLFNNNISKHEKLLSNFNDDDSNVMLLCLQNHHSGLDLYKSKHIIFMDALHGKPEHVRKLEYQAIGRAHRIGQTDTVKVIKMIMKNTIEDN